MTTLLLPFDLQEIFLLDVRLDAHRDRLAAERLMAAFVKNRQREREEKA